MKTALFIGITEYNLNKPNPHLEKKFSGLSNGVNIYVIARGKFTHKNIWNSDFYLIPYRIFYFPLACLFGCYLCIVKKVDTIVCQGPLTEGLVGVLLKYLFRKELIIEIHGDWQTGPFLNKKRFLAPVLRKIFPFVGSWTLHNADKIRTLTTILRDDMQRRFPKKQYFIFPTFTDIDIFLHEKDIRFQKYILTVAVLSPIKNIEALIDAFSKTHEEFSDFKLVIGGDGPSLESQKSKVKSQKLESSVIFTGRLSQIEVRDVMKDCYMFVLPSLSEGFGRVFIEAMALSKPVIGSNVGGVREIIKDGQNGFLVDPTDVDGLIARIRALLQSSELAKEMGQNGRNFVQANFSNEKYVRNYIKMINA